MKAELWQDPRLSCPIIYHSEPWTEWQSAGILGQAAQQPLTATQAFSFH